MKIKIQQNNNTNLSNVLSELNISEGYSFHGENLQKENSFSARLLNSIKDTLPSNSKAKKLSLQLMQALNLLNKTLKESFLSPINFEFNMPNQQFKAFKKLGEFLQSPKYKIIDFNPSYAKLSSDNIALDLNILENKDYHFIQNLKSSTSEENVMQFVLFHELGHLLSNVKTSNDSSMDLIVKKVDYFSATKTALFNKQYFSIENENFAPLDHMILMPLKSLKEEMYADVAALLFQRNVLIESHTFNIEKFNENIESLEKARLGYIDYTMEHAPEKWTINTELRFTKNITNCALDGLNSQLESLGYKVLNQEQISEISQQYANNGMAKYLYTVSRINDDYKKQFDTLFASSFDVEGKLGINFTQAQMNSQNLWNEIKNMIGQDWINSFEKKLKIIRSNPLTSENHDLAVFSAGMKNKEETLEKTYIDIKGLIKPKKDLKDRINELRESHYSNNRENNIKYG